jgi:hypothetical protein
LAPRLFAHPIKLLYPGTDQMHFSTALMNPGSFFAELKRRNVYKVAVAYAVIGWLLIQIATQTFPFLEIPNWAIRLVIMLVVIGFPISLLARLGFRANAAGDQADGICRCHAAVFEGRRLDFHCNRRRYPFAVFVLARPLYRIQKCRVGRESSSRAAVEVRCRLAVRES